MSADSQELVFVEVGQITTDEVQPMMENTIINVADCCRACLRIDCSLTPTSAPDTDSIKFHDKLLTCVSEITWQKEGLPSLICSTCIERLRVSFDFRNICLQSDQTLQRYITHLQGDESTIKVTSENRSLTTPTKFEFTISASPQVESGDGTEVAAEILVVEAPEDDQGSNVEYVQHLKHFLDSAEDLEHKSDELGEEQKLEGQDDPQVDSPIQIIESRTPLPKFEARQIIMRSTGIQVRPPTPPQIKADPTSNHHLPPAPKSYTCQICCKSYRKNANLRIHMRTHTGEKPFECKYCDKRFYHSSHLREHIRRHTGEKPFQCAVCSKRFTIKGELTMHMKSHTGEKPYACTCCERRCLTAADLKVHMRTHTGEKPFECGTCCKRFASSYILNSHIKTHTGERPYVCTICAKTFTQSSHLNVHMRKHTGEKVACKMCDAKFTHSSQLTVHMREHTGKQPYKCSMCDKICNYASELQAHMAKHTGEKFTCITCDKQFTTHTYLQEHIRTHTGENLLTCLICDRQFTRAQYLQKHMRTHTGEKPYVCSTCGKRFTQSSSLKVHIRIHTGEKPYPCTLCERRFTTSSDLSSHKKVHDKYIVL